jgi:hypothetical protein
MSRFFGALSIALVCGGFLLADTRPAFIVNVTRNAVTVQVTEKEAKKPQPYKTVKLARDATIIRLKDSGKTQETTVERKARRSDIQDAITAVKKRKGQGIFCILDETDGVVTRIRYYASYDDTGAHFRSLYQSKIVLVSDISKDSLTIRLRQKLTSPKRSSKTFDLAKGASIHQLKDSRKDTEETTRRKATLSDLQKAIDDVKRGKGTGVYAVLEVTDNKVTRIGYYASFHDTGAYFRSLSKKQ